MDVAFANDKLFAVIDGVLYKRVQGDAAYQALCPGSTYPIMYTTGYVAPANETLQK